MASSIYKTILKRSACRNSIEESHVDSVKRYDNLCNIIKESSNGTSLKFQNAIKYYIESMSNKTNASNYYYQPLELAIELNKISVDLTNTCLINNYINRILPYVEDVEQVYNNIDNYNLENEQKDRIREAARMINTADRIVANHKKLSSRFNIEKEHCKYKTLGLKYLVDSFANMVETYNVSNYQKMNITIEEVYYYLNKNGIDYNSEDLAKYTLEHYLTQAPYISESDMNKYRRVLTESYILEKQDLSSLKYLFENVEVNSIKTMVDNYIATPNKFVDKLSDQVEDIINKTSKQDIIYNSDRIIYLLWDLAKNKVFDSDKEVYDVSQIISNNIKSQLEEYAYSYDKEDLTTMLEYINTAAKYIHDTGNSNIDYSLAADMFIKECINPCIEELNELKDLVYTKSNLSIIEMLNTCTDVVPLEEHKKFRIQLVRAAYNLDKFLKIKEKKLYNKPKDKISNFIEKANNLLFNDRINENSLNIYEYIGTDYRMDIPVRRYAFNESNLNFVSDFLNSVCNEYNDVLLSQNESCRAYYLINPYNAEIRIKEPTAIMYEDTIADKIKNSIDDTSCLYINDIINSDEISRDIAKNIRSVGEMIVSITNESTVPFTVDMFNLALEAMSILGVDADLVSLFGDRFNEYQFNKSIYDGVINESYIKLARQEKIVTEAVDNWKALDEVSFEDKIKAYNYLDALFEYSFPKYEDDDEDDKSSDNKESKDKEEKKESNNKEAFDKLRDENKNMAKEMEKEVKEEAPKGGKPYKAKFTINDIKLGIMGLKEKIKSFSTKEKEMSNNLDNATRALVKGIKDSLVSDRREAIIKGSVIPSFSRCIKAAILLAGVAAFVSLPAAVIGAVGALALSKKLTHTERMLLLDEIETEIEVCDKELAIADSNNEINKYRDLLQYKKDLQRQYQRIKYNVRIGKDILPGTAGFKSKD